MFFYTINKLPPEAATNPPPNQELRVREPRVAGAVDLVWALDCNNKLLFNNGAVRMEYAYLKRCEVSWSQILLSQGEAIVKLGHRGVSFTFSRG